MHKTADNVVYILSDFSLPVIPDSSAETAKSRFIKTKKFQPKSEGESKRLYFCREHSSFSLCSQSTSCIIFVGIFCKDHGYEV